MDTKTIAAAVAKIFAARGKICDTAIQAVWVDGIEQYVAERKVSDSQLSTGLKMYFRGTDQFPVLGLLLDCIKAGYTPSQTAIEGPKTTRTAIEPGGSVNSPDQVDETTVALKLERLKNITRNVGL